MDCCVGVYGFFCTIPTVESYGAGFFVPARTLIAVKLLKGNETCAEKNEMESDEEGRVEEV